VSDRTRARSRRTAGASIAVAILLAACSAPSASGDDRTLVVATTSILGDIAAGVVGTEGTVEVLIPIGVDAHDFRPSAQEASLVAGADLVVANGLGLEQGLEDVLAAAAAEGTPVIELAPLLGPIPLITGKGDDPHFWMDPIRVGEAATALASELTRLEAAGSWGERAAAYAAEMTTLNQGIRSTLEVIPATARKMVTNHEALGYFADRYGFEIVGVVIPGGSTLAEPSSAELAALVEVMRDEGIRVIFAETTRPTMLADAVASELGDEVEVVELFTESLGPEGSGAETLSEMLLTNAGRIAASLG
jgi:zinc/manganese transport system substrate-binding protein